MKIRYWRTLWAALLWQLCAAGGYRDALRFKPGQLITFNADAFIQSRPPNMQPFLRKVLQLQTFQQFIADRLDMLNAGVGFSDEFEVEVNMSGDVWGTQSRYRDWLNHMKVYCHVLIFLIITRQPCHRNDIIRDTRIAIHCMKQRSEIWSVVKCIELD